MKRIMLYLLASVVVLTLHILDSAAQTEKATAKTLFGQIEKVSIGKGGGVSVTYWPIEDFQYYMTVILNDSKTPDVKTENQVRSIDFILNKSEECSKLQSLHQKEGFNVVAIELNEKKISLINLGYRKFAKSVGIYYKQCSEL